MRKQQVQVDVAQQISITAALEAAQGRVARGLAVEVEDAVEVRKPLARTLPVNEAV